MSKGSIPRKINRSVYRRNWEAIFRGQSPQFEEPDMPEAESEEHTQIGQKHAGRRNLGNGGWQHEENKEI